MSEVSQKESELISYLQLQAKADEYLLTHPNISDIVGREVLYSTKQKTKLIAMYSLMFEIINLNGVVFGGFVRDTLRFFEQINYNTEYNIYGDPTPIKDLNDLDVIITQKSFNLLFKCFSYKRIKYHEISIASYTMYPQKMLNGYKHRKFYIIYNSLTLTVDFNIQDNTLDSFTLKDAYIYCDFDVNSLYIMKCNCIDYINKEIAPCTNIHYGKHRNRLIIGTFINIPIKDIFDAINNKSATCIYIQEAEVFNYRIDKMLSKNYKIIYSNPTYLQPIELISINCLERIQGGMHVRIYRQMINQRDISVDLDDVDGAFDQPLDMEIHIMENIRRSLEFG